MIVRTRLLEEIQRRLAVFAAHIKMNSQNRMTGNVAAEDFVASLLGLIYGYQFINIHASSKNYGAIDLGDENAEEGRGVAVQVTSSNTRQKAIRTLKHFTESNGSQRLCDRYKTLIILIMTMDEKFKDWNRVESDDCTIRILNLLDLCSEMEQLEIKKLQQIRAFLSHELASDNGKQRLIENVGTILDARAVAEAESNCTDEDINKFYMVDTNFARLMRVVCANQDVPHKEIDKTLFSLCTAGKPAILSGSSGTGKSTIMLRTAISWVRQGNLAIWIHFCDTSVFSEFTVKQFYSELQQMISRGQHILLCLDNPSDNVEALRALVSGWPGDERIGLMLTERSNRLMTLAHPNSDLLRGWFDDACVVAILPENSNFRLKDYTITCIPDTYQRKARILERTVSVLARTGAVKPGLQREVVHQIMKDYSTANSSLVELIYQTQFRLRDFATKPENLRMDWDEWKAFLKRKLGIKQSSAALYGVIALCSLFAVPVSVDFYCRFFNIRRSDLLDALHEEHFSKSNASPVFFRTDSDTLLPKHSLAADLFFLFHRDTFDHNALMRDIIAVMDEFEVTELLQKMVRKAIIRKGTRGVLNSVRYRDYLIQIYQRVMHGTLGLNSDTKSVLALGLLYTAPKTSRTITGSETLKMVDSLDICIGPEKISASLYTEWGILLARQGLTQAAEEKFSSAITNSPSYIPARIELGRLISRQPGRESEAELLLREAMNIDPNNIPSRTELGRLLAKQTGRDAEAELLLREAIKIDPKNIHSRTELSRLLAKQPGREAEAELLLREIIKIDPNNIQSRTELGCLLARQPGREAEAELCLREVINIDPKNTYSRTELGRLLAKQPGREAEAELFWREVLRANPSDPYARVGLAKLQEQMQNTGTESAPLIPDISIPGTSVVEKSADEGHEESTFLPVADEEFQDPDEPITTEPDELDELKIIFLGDGEAGKTLTIARLLNEGGKPEPYDGSTTPGISISEMEYQISDKTVKANIWDFGGQEILHSMHRMFLTGRTVYVILLNAREDNMDNRAQYWLQNLKSFANGSPALLVINKIDGNSKAAVNEPELRKLYPQLTKIIKMSALHYTKDQFNQSFTNALYELISSFEASRTPLQPEWKRLKARIRNTEADIISNNDFLRHCRECGIEDDPDTRELILEMFQDLGICFCFGDKKLDNHIILSPEWITNAIYMILFNEHPDLNNGILSRDSIIKLLCPEENSSKSIHRILPNMTYKPEDVDYVLAVIRKFSLSYSLENDEEFVPMLCDRNTPAITEEYYHNPDVLEFRIEYNYLPSNVIHNLMVRMRTDLATEVVWYTGAKFVDMSTNCTAIVRSNDHTLEIYIRPEISSAFSFVYLRKLLDTIEQVNRDLSLSFRKQIIAYKADDKTQYFDYTHLVKGLARGTTTVYSANHDKSVPVSEILNPNSSCDPDRQQLIGDIISTCRNLQRNKRYWDWDENGMNCYMREMLEMKNYVVRDQTLSGTGATGSSDGEVDLDVRKEANQEWTIIEAMWIKESANRPDWNKHLTKLLIDYNRWGLPFLIQVCYVNCSRSKFERLSRTHLNHLQDYAPDKYIIHNSIPIETVPFGYEPNNLMFGAECTYVFDKGDSISRTTVCHIFVFIGDDAS